VLDRGLESEGSMIGQTISHYKILEKLGEGGMGVVYKAQDTKLDRLVALKFLPEHVSASSADLERFTQEAKAAASLTHPNVCTIYGIEEADGKRFIVMEFVDGKMLEEVKSTLSMKEALEIGIQIAEGLAAAHEKGIVHRDIKPENIMIRKDGRVQVMDFGLAKLRGASRLTKEGSTVGTAGYMSPEQVQGQETDHRSDIFSLGVLLFEMFTGQLPFKGVHETAIAYEVVNVDSPPMSSIKPEIPPELDVIILECLEKDPKERTQSASQVAVDLKRFRRTSSRSRMSRIMPAGAVPRSSTSTGQAAASRNLLRFLPWTMTAVLGLVLIAWIVFSRSAAHETVSYLNVSAVNSADQLIYHSDRPCLAISPDGRLLVYTLSESGISQLYTRSLDRYEAHRLQGTTNATSPFFSPDGRWIGFEADGKLKKIPADGGTVETLCDVNGFRGGSWGPDNMIYFAPSLSSGLMRIPATGGKPSQVSTLDSTKGERTHRWPQVLPGGKWILYTVGDEANPNSYADAILTIQSIETGERHELNVRGEMAHYVEPGFIVVGRKASLLAAPFSLDDFAATTSLTTLVEGVDGDPGSGVLNFSVSANGNLVYLAGNLNRDRQLVWVTREGKVTPLPLQPQPLRGPHLSPDNTRLAYGAGDMDAEDVWIFDFKKEAASRLTFGKKAGSPLWSLDGRFLYYAASAPPTIIIQPADGSSPGKEILKSGVPVFPAAIMDKGRKMVVSMLAAQDIMITDLENNAKQVALIKGDPYAYGGSVSPDGRFITYGVNEAGGLNVYVRSLPDLKGKWQISTNGGINPVWSPRGDEIFYVSTVGKMMTVSVKTTPVFSYGPPKELFDVSQMLFPNTPITNFDVTKDGQRFVMVQNTRTGGRTTSFNYVQNWKKELEERLK